MERKEQHHGGLSTGFLLGVIVGVVITLLLTTKRGKRILKLITEEGMQKLSNFEDVFEDMVEEYEVKPEAPKEKAVDAVLEEESAKIEREMLEESKHEETKSQKRFFKGVPRRSIN